MSLFNQCRCYPVLALRGIVVFPNMVLPFSISRQAAIAATEEAMAGKEKVVMLLSQKDTAVNDPGADDLFSVGTTATVKIVERGEDNLQILLQGLERAEVTEYVQQQPFLKAKVKPLLMPPEEGVELEALQREVMDMTGKFLSLGHPELTFSLPAFIAPNEDIMLLLYPLSQLIMPQHHLDAQAILQAQSRITAMLIMRKILSHEIQVLQIRHKIASQTQEKINREQREHILRQQLLAIQQELGDKATAESEIEELRRRYREGRLPEEVKGEVEKELGRLGQTPISSPDYQVIQTHLELILELPWHQETTDCLELTRARRILDEDHFGLREVKERIIEHLAVMKLNPQAKAPILCFIGPPGVGKTSLGQSIARALDRKFERFSLGGMHDEAELRGHRRTYIGAMPGRIIQAIRRAGVKNPLLMLDEVDKLSHDFRGDPAAALMEILDPAQNSSFRDNYLDLPFDLSKTFFITTANQIDAIPKPLLDRTEIIRLSGYSDEEKMAIARQYLLPHQRREAGLSAEQLEIPDPTLMAVISGYTREAGLRELERTIGRLARKIAVRVAEEDREPVSIQPSDLTAMLGPPKFYVEHLRQKLPAGVAIGLAWTESGGDILYVEAIALPTGDKITLTGQLGEVMKESAIAANNYVIAHCEALGLTQDKPPIHIHVPAGAIPKDGPSAGVTMAAALASLYSQLPVRSDTAMTGEITLSGLLLPVGGIKEKVLAAQRAGLRRIALPRENQKDLQELPDHVRQAMEFVFADTIQEVLKEVIPNLNFPPNQGSYFGRRLGDEQRPAEPALASKTS